jgi:beta-glucosidase
MSMGDATTSSGQGGGGPDGAAGGGDGSIGTLPDASVRAWPSAACQAQTAALLGMMTRAEKAGQMLMANTNASMADLQNLAPGGILIAGGGSPTGMPAAAAAWATWTDSFQTAAAATRLKVPVLIGLDAVHGNNGATGTTIFPHNAGLGSSRDPALVSQVTHITALETAGVGVNWIYGPVVSVAWDYRWGRVYESFSGDETLTGLLAAASVLGVQGSGGLNTGNPGVVACAKHFAGDGQMGPPSSKGGVVDRGNITLDLAGLTKYGINPYVPVIQAGLGCIMVSDARWNNTGLTSDAQIITTILKGQLGFKGFVISDYDAANPIPPAINAGVDMCMVGGGWQNAIATITNSAAIPDSRINDAVTRILNVKCEAGLFTNKRDPALLTSVGSPEHRAVARKAVSASLVVLQNTGNVLPLAKTSKVFIEGSGANSLDKQCGGWTISWQGSGSKTTGTTIQQAITKVTPPMATLAQADVDIVVLGEPPYAEFVGDRMSIDTLPATDLALVDAAHAAGKKVVAIVLSGRPVLITPHLANADVWIAAWLPGTEGDGVADVVFGDYKPTGKLSHAWPKAATDFNIMTAGFVPQFPIGFGL